LDFRLTRGRPNPTVATLVRYAEVVGKRILVSHAAARPVTHSADDLPRNGKIVQPGYARPRNETCHQLQIQKPPNT